MCCVVECSVCGREEREEGSHVGGSKDSSGERVFTERGNESGSVGEIGVDNDGKSVVGKEWKLMGRGHVLLDDVDDFSQSSSSFRKQLVPSYTIFSYQFSNLANLFDSIVVSIPPCHGGDRGSIPRQRMESIFLPFFCS